MREIRAPNTEREKMSRPSGSVPNQLVASGQLEMMVKSVSIGLRSGSRLAVAASTTTIVVQANGIQKRGPSRWRASGRLGAPLAGVLVWASPSAVALIGGFSDRAAPRSN